MDTIARLSNLKKKLANFFAEIDSVDGKHSFEMNLKTTMMMKEPIAIV